jgi:drug/metabolite transporter (DMT)-like permease
VITFTTPLFLTVLAALVLHERVRWRRWSATAIGFGGVLIMLRPGEGVLELAALVALFGASCIATVRLVIKRLTWSDGPLTIIVWFGLISTAVSAVWCGARRRSPSSACWCCSAPLPASPRCS